MDSTEVLRPQAVNDLLAEVDGFDPTLFPPRNERKESETVIGIAGAWVQRAFSLASYYRRERDRLSVEARYEDQSDRTSDEMYRAHAKHDILMELVWYSLRKQFDTTIPNVGLRKNWEFVEAEPGPRDLLRQMFGSE
jgi:hypothetical protein